MKLKILLPTILLCFGSICYAQNKDVFVCLPCGSACDAMQQKKPGQCEHCQMPLVAKASIKHTSVPPEKVCQFIAGKKDVVLLDVRTREEFNGTGEENFGTLKNAINIPIQELENRLSELAPHKAKTILVFCSHSHRSPRASYLLTQNGFKNVVNMDGGMSVVGNIPCKKMN
ncbi:MAG TPA: rhodanese-like domain-containing protein [Chryseosolibacter sp.]